MENVNENHVKIGLVIEANKSIHDLQNTVKSIKGICYPASKIKVVISCKNGVLSPQQLINELEEIKTTGIKGNVVIHLKEADSEVIDTDTFDTLMSQHGSDYLIKINAGSHIDNDFFNFINSNSKSTQFIFEDVENNTLAINHDTVNHFYLSFRSYDLMIAELIPNLKDEKTYLKYDKKN